MLAHMTLNDGTTRTFLLGGDAVVIRATAPGANGATVDLDLGMVEGRIVAA